ncbi:MAG: MiaB/RimO family radical SAM methylthiotransferase, partial [Candidatus Omnitrophica bacterium]|nr:MiaB/RimO family radical SAM methylthiotransferase [Candidatus Omnitrophota bacterium]
GVDLIVKNDKKDKIIALIQGQPPPGTVPVSGISSFKGHTRAFLKVQDGCNNFCSYCKVPLVRGRSRSKAVKDVTREAEVLVKNGFKEVVLTGICLGAYGRDLKPKSDLSGLVANLEKIKGLLRIRLSSIEAKDISDGLIKLISHSKKVCRHFHIPLQSGDDTVLKRMNRKYSREGYLSLVRKIKKEIPGVSISIDVLVGFPGEDNRMFLNTAQLIKSISPFKVHIFPYSERKGTKAAGLPQKLDPRVIRQRIEMLKLISEECGLRFKNKFFNKKMLVLVEGRVKGNPLLWEGYTDNYLPVNLCSKRQLQNQMVLVKCTGINENNNLTSVIVDN